ncbi:MAG: GNAT family N-acetyltransferase, partial [Desulfobacteraceae bacterium]|nr:GNAT family N-acetyltransferase [Desulfobacteraceae bacterium]
DWKDVVNIYNLSKPDELRGSVNLQALIPLEDDKNSIKQFHESEILVAEVNNQIAGFGGNKGNCISWLFVHPNYRRKGVAQLILNQILETLEGTVKLNVAKNNLAAKTLYTKLGFIVEREFEGNYNGYKSQAMTLSLSKSS